MPDGDTVTVPKQDLYDLYSALADATDAAAVGDSNECAAKAAEAKRMVKSLGEDSDAGE